MCMEAKSYLSLWQGDCAYGQSVTRNGAFFLLSAKLVDDKFLLSNLENDPIFSQTPLTCILQSPNEPSYAKRGIFTMLL